MPSETYDSGYLSHQRGLLEHLLRVTREQRRHLVEGNLEGLAQSNRLLKALLDRQSALSQEYGSGAVEGTGELSDRVRDLAKKLREESQANYLLACRGAQFADFSTLMARAKQETAQAPAGPPSKRTAGMLDART